MDSKKSSQKHSSKQIPYVRTEESPSCSGKPHHGPNYIFQYRMSYIALLFTTLLAGCFIMIMVYFNMQADRYVESLQADKEFPYSSRVSLDIDPQMRTAVLEMASDKDMFIPNIPFLENEVEASTRQKRQVNIKNPADCKSRQKECPMILKVVREATETMSTQFEKLKNRLVELHVLSAEDPNHVNYQKIMDCLDCANAISHQQEDGFFDSELPHNDHHQASAPIREVLPYFDNRHSAEDSEQDKSNEVKDQHSNDERVGRGLSQQVSESVTNSSKVSGGAKITEIIRKTTIVEKEQDEANNKENQGFHHRPVDTSNTGDESHVTRNIPTPMAMPTAESFYQQQQQQQQHSANGGAAGSNNPNIPPGLYPFILPTAETTKYSQQIQIMPQAGNPPLIPVCFYNRPPSGAALQQQQQQPFFVPQGMNQANKFFPMNGPSMVPFNFQSSLPSQFFHSGSTPPPFPGQPSFPAQPPFPSRNAPYYCTYISPSNLPPQALSQMSMSNGFPNSFLGMAKNSNEEESMLGQQLSGAKTTYDDSDEKYWADYCNGFTCPPPYKKCIRHDQRCDGRVDCIGAEDEIDCPPLIDPYYTRFANQERPLQLQQGSAQSMQGSTQSLQGSVQPMQGSVQSIQEPMQPMQGSMHSIQGSMQPMQGYMLSMQGSAQPMQGSTQSLQGSVQPMQGSVQSTQESMQPMQGSMHSRQGSMKPIQESMQSMQGSTLQESVQPIQGSMQLTQGSMQPMQGSVHSIQGSMQPIQESMQSMQGSTLQGSVQSMQGSTQSLQGSMQPIQGPVESMQGSMQSMQGSVQSMQGSVQPMQGSVQSMQGSMQPMQGAMQPMQGSMNGQSIQGSVSPMQGSVQSTQGSSQWLQGPMQPMQESVQSTQGSTQWLQGSMQSMQGSVQPMQGSSLPMQRSMQSMQGSVQPMQGSMQSMQGSIQPMQGSIQPMQGSMQSMQGYTQPMQGSMSVMQGSMQPVQGYMHPMQGLMQIQQNNPGVIQDMTGTIIPYMATTISPAFDTTHTNKVETTTIKIVVPQLPKQFTCKRIIQTVSLDKRCNGIFDCEDASDEEGCTCRDYLQHQRPFALCDGHVDCDDGTDEQGCNFCPDDQYHCHRSGSCIPKSNVCNQMNDCKLNEDELDCLVLTDGKHVNLDLDGRPHLNLAGVATRYDRGAWRSQCVRPEQHGQNTRMDAGQKICEYLGFSNVDSVSEVVVPTSRLEVRSATSDESIAYEYPPHFMPLSRGDNNTCYGLYVRCKPILGRKVNVDLKIDPTTKARSYIWPWEGSVFVDGKYHCPAVLLENDLMLASAKCSENIDLRHNYTTVVFGVSSPDVPYSGPYQQASQILDIQPIKNSEASLFRLKDGVNMTRYVQPIYMEKKIFPATPGDSCVALGVNGRGQRKMKFLSPVVDGCPKCHRCYADAKEVPCSRANETINWSGNIVCLSNKGGWYPTAVFQDKDENCGFSRRQTLNSIDYIHAHLSEAIGEPRSRIEVPACEGVRCTFGECIPWNRVCDGIRDCRDGTDENPATCNDLNKRCKENIAGCKCSQSELRCGNGKCVSKEKFCDGKMDCEDGSDEPASCTCAEYLKLTKPKLVCDNRRHCLDKSDEDPRHCTCKDNSFKCSKSTRNDTMICVSQDVVCDGQPDCPEGEDEADHACMTIKSEKFDGHGRGEVQRRSYGVWQSVCTPEPVDSLATVQKACTKMGYRSGLLLDNTKQADSVYVARNDFYMFQPNNHTWITLREDDSFGTWIRATAPCYKLRVHCF